MNEQPYVVFDLETTDNDPETCRIVELAMVQFYPETFEIQGTPWVERVDPGQPIQPEAEAAHGISQEDVSGCPPFSSVASQVQKVVDTAVLVGYNSRRFDTLVLHHELRRAGFAGVDLARVREIDVYELWWQLEPRTLAGAVRRFLGEDLDDAHEAEADATATLRVLREMIEGAPQLPELNLEKAIDLSRPEGEVDRAGKLSLDDEGQVCLGFGKHKGTPCSQVPVSYYRWMAKAGDFPEETMNLLRALQANRWEWPLPEEE